MLCNIISVYHGSLMLNLYLAGDSWYVYIYIYQSYLLSTNHSKRNTMVQSTLSVFLSQSLYGLSPDPCLGSAWDSQEQRNKAWQNGHRGRKHKIYQNLISMEDKTHTKPAFRNSLENKLQRDWIRRMFIVFSWCINPDAWSRRWCKVSKHPGFTIHLRYQ